MKQFENLNSVMEPKNHSKNMANLKNLLSRGKFLFLIIVIFVLNSCGAKLYYIKQNPKQNEISLSSDLRQFVSTNKAATSCNGGIGKIAALPHVDNFYVFSPSVARVENVLEAATSPIPTTLYEYGVARSVNQTNTPEMTNFHKAHFEKITADF
jgi:hypothetical protein